MGVGMTPSRQHGFMKSSWHELPWSQQTWGQRLLNTIQPANAPKPPIRVGQIPVFTSWSQTVWVIKRGILPVAAQAISQRVFGLNWHPVAAWLIYCIAYILISINTIKLFLGFNQKWGVFNGKAPRDKIPDSRVDNLAWTLQTATFVRVACGALLLYDAKQPVYLSPFLPLKGVLYSLILDLGFYTYHRLSHEVDWLWHIHSTHHMTKAPSPALAILAGEEQEFLEVFVLPLATSYLTACLVPLTFHEWYLIALCIIFGEILGHAGVRAHVEASLTAPYLRWLGAELANEDHDFHHRQGWRKTTNYGKQSRFWDWVFGTMGERVESRAENINWSLSVFDEVPAQSVPKEEEAAL